MKKVKSTTLVLTYVCSRPSEDNITFFLTGTPLDASGVQKLIDTGIERCGVCRVVSPSALPDVTHHRQLPSDEDRLAAFGEALLREALNDSTSSFLLLITICAVKIPTVFRN